MKRSMIVDGSSVIRQVAKRILAGPEMLVVEAANGSEALAMCAASRPDYIIVDNGLTDMTAVEFIREALSLPGGERPAIVLCMTEFDIGAIMRAKRAGARGYVLKPFNRAQLLERFRMVQAAA